LIRCVVWPLACSAWLFCLHILPACPAWLSCLSCLPVLPAGGTPLRLGLLPIKDPSQGRTANLITLPDHPVWNVKDGETMYRVFEQAFPQVCTCNRSLHVQIGRPTPMGD
jgi:hypothetical protein